MHMTAFLKEHAKCVTLNNSVLFYLRSNISKTSARVSKHLETIKALGLIY